MWIKKNLAESSISSLHPIKILISALCLISEFNWNIDKGLQQELGPKKSIISKVFENNERMQSNMEHH